MPTISFDDLSSVTKARFARTFSVYDFDDLFEPFLRLNEESLHEFLSACSCDGVPAEDIAKIKAAYSERQDSNSGGTTTTVVGSTTTITSTNDVVDDDDKTNDNDSEYESCFSHDDTHDLKSGGNDTSTTTTTTKDVDDDDEDKTNDNLEYELVFPYYDDTLDLNDTATTTTTTTNDDDNNNKEIAANDGGQDSWLLL